MDLLPELNYLLSSRFQILMSVTCGASSKARSFWLQLRIPPSSGAPYTRFCASVFAAEPEDGDDVQKVYDYDRTDLEVSVAHLPQGPQRG